MLRLRFMAGLPRSGTTMLASVMNQNENVYLSPQSELVEQLRMIHLHSGEDMQLGVMRSQHEALLRGAPDAFYSDMGDRIIIDKSRKWGAPYYLRLLEYVLGEPPRILCPVRPLTEVVSSFIRKAQENPNTNYIDRAMIAEDFLPYWRKPLDDARVDWLLRPGGMIDSAMLSVSSAFREDTAHLFHVFTYHDLVHFPGKTLDGIYDFIEASRYPHTFGTIPPSEPHDDATALGIPDLHAVRPVLSITAPPPESVLSDYALTRCAIEDFWTR